jgi:ABC-2 type transport system permease protein/oleandomycin transport system permease protein
MIDALKWGVLDTLVITKRNILRYAANIQLIFFATLQPVIFLSLFNYVFGGSLGSSLPKGYAYIMVLLPGILVQTSLFSGVNTGIGLAEDINAGVIDRFRSLPMSRVAVVAGRIFADALRSVFVTLLLIIVGYAYGFRFENGILGALGLFVLSIALSFTFSWFAALIGITLKDAEATQVVGFMLIFPLTFASSVFAPIVGMPDWLQAFARNQPVTHAAEAFRYMAVGLGSTADIWKTLAWLAAIVIIFAPLTIRKYKKA